MTIVGIALSAWVLVSLLGFNQGYENSLNKDIDNMGFQLMIMAKGCPYEAATLMLKGGTGLRYMDESIIKETLLKEPRSTESASRSSCLLSSGSGTKGDGGMAGVFRVEAANVSVK